MADPIPEELIEAGRGYETLFVPALFDVWTKHLLEHASIGPGLHVLDVACGTGVLARHAHHAVGESGRVVGVDPAPGMLAAAQEREPAIEWVQCTAEALELQDASFDAVVSQFGIMFFEDRAQAAREMFRVLKPGGSVAIAAWRSVDHNPAYKHVIDILQSQVSEAAADALRLPFGLGDAQPVQQELMDAGFSEVRVTACTETARFASVRQMVEAELRGWLPMFDIVLSEEKISEILAVADEVLQQYATAEGTAEFPTAAHIFSASKP